MAQKAQVLDVGSYSAKSVASRIPLVGYAVAGGTEKVCASALEPRTRRAEQAKLLKELLPGKRVTGDSVTVIMPVERALNRFLDMPFTDRSKIDSVLAFELENHVPLSADEFIHDYVILEKRKDGAKLFVSLLPLKEVEELQEAFVHLNIDPRVVIHQAVANARLAELLAEPPAKRAAFIDVGHRKTVVTLVENGRFAGCRVLLHGGYDLTRTLSESLSVTMEEAEQAKLQAHLFPAGEGLAVGRVQEVADTLREGLGPLVRDLHQTLRTQGGVDEIYLFGGGARLGGIDLFLKEALQLPVTLLHPSLLKVGGGFAEDGLQYVSGLAAGFASHKGSDAQRVNFRQGHFAYEGDFRFVRGRLVYLGLLLVFMLAAFGAPQVLRYRSVLDQEEQLTAELSRLSGKILGEELEDWDEVLGRLEDMPSAEVWTVFPDLTAHEVYWEVADIVTRIDGQPTGEMVAPPAPEEAAPAEGAEGDLPPPSPGPESPAPLDGSAPPPEGAPAEPAAPAEPVEAVHHLDMNQIRVDGASRTTVGDGAVEYTGNASSVATMELFLTMLGKHACFHNVQRTKQEMLKATAGKEGWWRFTVEFTVSCPRKAVEELAKEKEAAEEKAAAGKEKEGEEKEKEGEKEGRKEKKGKGKKGAIRKVEPAAPEAPAPEAEAPAPEKKEAEEKPARPGKSRTERKKPSRERDAAREQPEERSRTERPTPEERRAEAAGSEPRRLNRPIQRNVRTNRPLVPNIPHDRLVNPLPRGEE